MKQTVFVIVCAMALSACASLEPAPASQVQPKRPPVPAWILEPGPNLIQLLDALISPYEKESTEQAPSLPPAKTN